MSTFLIDTRNKQQIDADMNTMFAGKAKIRSEIQDGLVFIIFVAELETNVFAAQVFDLFDASESFLSSALPPWAMEPRWMLSFHVKGRTLYANVGGMVVDNG